MRIAHGIPRLLLADRGIVAQDVTNSDSEQVQEFNHSYYQGLLLYIGNMKKLETYVPAQDKNRRCINVKLGEISTLTLSLIHISEPTRL